MKYAALAAIVSFLAGIPIAIGQQSFEWQNTSNANLFWQVPSNWSPSGVPDALDNAFISANGNYEVWWDTATGNTSALQTFIEASGNIRLLNLSTTNRTHTTNNFLTSGDVTLIGIDVILESNLGGLTAVVGDGTATLDGNHPTGTSFSQPFPGSFKAFNNSRFLVTAGADANIFSAGIGEGGDITVNGSGSTLFCDELVMGILEFPPNFARAFLNVEAGATVAAADTQLGFEIFATISVTGDGSSFFSDQLELGSTFSDAVEISNNGSVIIQDSTSIGVNGGVVISTGGHFDFGTMDINDLLRVSGSDGSIAGNILNTETVYSETLLGLQGIDLDTSNLFLLNSGTLLGSATLDCSLCNTAEVRLLSGERLAFTAASGGVTNEGDIHNFGGTLDVTGEFTNEGFVAGRGLFVAGDGHFNDSVMAFSGTTDFLGDMFNGGQIVNSGLSTMTFVDDVDNNGVEIRTSAGSNTVIFGAATGAGSYTGVGTVFFEGDLQPGNSPAQVTFDGDVVLGGSAITEIELAGTSTGQFDQLIVNGDFAAGGILFVTTIDGFQLRNGMSFEIADIGMQSSGQFFGLSQGSIVANIDGLDLTIDYTGGDRPQRSRRSFTGRRKSGRSCEFARRSTVCQFAQHWNLPSRSRHQPRRYCEFTGRPTICFVAGR